MKFLAIIIAVMLLQVWGSGARLQHDGWFRGWRARVEGWNLSGGLGLALLVLPPVLLAQYVFASVEPVLFGLLWLVLAVIMLMYAFGRGDFHALMARYRGQAYSGDFEGAYLAADAEFGLGGVTPDPASAQEVHSLIQRALLYEGFQRWFAVLFWFVVLGPAGILAYRLLQLCRRDFEPELTRRCLFVADWVPARLLAVAFSLTGNFIASREVLLHAIQDVSRDTSQLLHSVACASLDLDVLAGAGEGAEFGPEAAAQNREFAGLLSRSAVCWVVVLSLLVLLS